MKFVLAVAGVITLLAAFGVFGSAKSAIHEIYAAVLLLISTVCFVGAAVIGAVRDLNKLLQKHLEPPK